MKNIYIAFVLLVAAALCTPMVSRAAIAVRTADTQRLVAESERELEQGDSERENETNDGQDDGYGRNVLPQPVTQQEQAPQENGNTNTDTAHSVDSVTSTALPQAPAPPQISTAFPWAWTAARAAGLASYLLLALQAIFGMLLTTGVLYRIMSPATAWSYHRAIASTLLLSVAVHICAILFDSFMGFRPIDVLVPFVSPFKPLLVALGITGFYLLLLVLVTSLYTMTNHARFWRTVHFFSFVTFTSIFLHGILIGTDMKITWVRVLYWAAAVCVFMTALFRLWWKFNAPRSESDRPRSLR